MSMFEPCPTCGGSGSYVVQSTRGPLETDTLDCPSCVGGRVVSESVIEEMGRAIRVRRPNLREPSSIQAARAAARVVLEHWERTDV